MRERLKRLEQLLTDPFKPEDVLKELEELLKEIPQMKREELLELEKEMAKIKEILERNYHIALGWVEELPQKIKFERKV
jgi:ATP phosphoribosyltransferase regulatory subunit HisZ